jgi:hypothetical protein
MSTETATTDPKLDPNYIPDDSEVPTPTGRCTWRISDGKIQTGRDVDGTLQTKEKLVGRLRRVSIHTGTLRDKATAYTQLEIDLETAQGPTRVKTSLSDTTGALKPSVGACSFAEALLDVAKDELIVITANSSAKPNKYGKHSTYVNIGILKPGQVNATPTKRRPYNPDLTLDEHWEQLAAEILKHAAYKARPEREDSRAPGGSLDGLNADLKAREWPTVAEIPDVWLAQVRAVYHMDEAEVDTMPTIASIKDDVWNELRLKLASLEGPPKMIREWIAKNGGAPKTADMSALE